MKTQRISYLITLFVVLTTSCKPVHHTIIKPFLDVAWIPVTNQDLLNLQLALLHYRKVNNMWPSDIVDLVEVNKKDSIGVEFNKFNTIQWSPVGDSLLVDYKLQYDDSDTIQYKYLSGKFYLLPNVDTLQASHIDINGEKKDGTLSFESNSKNKKSRIKK